MKIDAHPDADFAGLWGSEDPQDPVSVRSRTGFVICVSDCPVLWVSKLQTEISKMEAVCSSCCHSFSKIGIGWKPHTDYSYLYESLLECQLGGRHACSESARPELRDIGCCPEIFG